MKNKWGKSVLFRFLNAGGNRQSENCLHLNVWTPGLDGARRPVLVWIHGGGFLIGAGSTAVYEGHDLARQPEEAKRETPSPSILTIPNVANRLSAVAPER